jgi:hypothetical protein
MGSCPLQAGEAFLKMPHLLQPPLRAVPIVSAVVRAQARETATGSCAISVAAKKTLARRAVDLA